MEATELGNAIEALYGGYRYNGDRLQNEIKKAIKSRIFNESDVMTDRERAIHAVCEWLGLGSIEELIAAVRSECDKCGTPTCNGKDCTDFVCLPYDPCKQPLCPECGDPRDTNVVAVAR